MPSTIRFPPPLNGTNSDGEPWRPARRTTARLTCLAPLGRRRDPPPPDEDALVARFAGRVESEELSALHRWLSALPVTPTLPTAVAALEGGSRWLRAGTAWRGGEPAPVARLRLLVEALEEVPAWRRAFGACVERVCAETRVVPALESGLPNDRGLWPESADRLSRRCLPVPDEEHDLGGLLSRLFPSEGDAAWLGAVPPELAGRCAAVVRQGARGAWAPLAHALLEAIAVLGVRTAALGLSRGIHARGPEVAVTESPFFHLPRACDTLCAGFGSASACRKQITACHAALQVVRAHLERFGVSVDIVYRIEVIGQNLARLDGLLAVLEGSDLGARAAAAFALLGRISGSRVRDRSVRDILRTNLRLLARKAIEHAGGTGERYITATRGEWWRMMASGAGGGLLMTATTVAKFLVVWAELPLFLEGAFASANYALSFLAMQLCHFTLATKQPSMIAAALAGSLRGSDAEPRLDHLVTLTARICRSQLAAAIGNVALVMVGAVSFDLLYAHRTGHPFLDAHAAEHTIASLHPLRSGTIAFAALTGVLLWLSSLAAGWLENWSTFRRLPEAIAGHRWGRVIGRQRMTWLGHVFARAVAGVGGNVSIGVLLGMVPMMGRFVGLPLEVRHVTLATGSLTLAVRSVGAHAGLGAAVAGIAVILALNFSVSFALALAVALRARGVVHAGRRLLRAIATRFVAEPLPFLIPVEGDDEEAATRAS